MLMLLSTGVSHDEMQLWLPSSSPSPSQHDATHWTSHMDHRILTHLHKDVLERGCNRGALSLCCKDSDKSVKVVSTAGDEGKSAREVRSLLHSNFTQPRPHLSLGIHISCVTVRLDINVDRASILAAC